MLSPIPFPSVIVGMNPKPTSLTRSEHAPSAGVSMANRSISRPPSDGAQNRNDDRRWHIAKPDLQQNRYGVEGIDRNLRSSDVVDECDRDRQRERFGIEPGAGLLF